MLGHYSQPQLCGDADCPRADDRAKCSKSYALEAVADDAPEILAWKARQDEALADAIALKEQTHPQALLDRFAAIEAENAALKKRVEELEKI